MCSNKSLCHLLVALNVFTAAVLVHGEYRNSTFSYTRFGGVRHGGRSEEEDTVQLERMLRDLFGGLNASSFHQASSSGGAPRQKRFIHYDYSDNAVNVWPEGIWDIIETRPRTRTHGLRVWPLMWTHQTDKKLTQFLTLLFLIMISLSCPFQLGMEFSVHFLSIPVKKTIDTAMGFLEVLPKTTFNLNALFIGILFAVVGVVANGFLDAKSAAQWQTLRSALEPMMTGGGAQGGSTSTMVMMGADGGE